VATKTDFDRLLLLSLKSSNGTEAGVETVAQNEDSSFVAHGFYEAKGMSSQDREVNGSFE